MPDFWYSHCGGCFKEFPDVQKFYDSHNDRIAFYSVYCRLTGRGETPAGWDETFRDRGYTFPCLSMDMDDAVLKEELGVNAFPTIVIFAPDGRMVFMGDLDTAKKYLGEELPVNQPSQS
ncbi:MAG: TlpA family protein disulfide reductase [Rikenellaceae bacterium]|nr:TlpA family protein disulfide reductase [Rikenellaceae bacterium]